MLWNNKISPQYITKLINNGVLNNGVLNVLTNIGMLQAQDIEKYDTRYKTLKTLFVGFFLS